MIFLLGPIHLYSKIFYTDYNVVVYLIINTLAQVTTQFNVSGDYSPKLHILNSFFNTQLFERLKVTATVHNILKLLKGFYIKWVNFPLLQLT